MFSKRYCFIRFLTALAGAVLLWIIIQPKVALADTITVTGDITTTTTWINGNVYLATGDVRVVSGVTLTIQPGTVVKFQNDKSLLVNGKLVAVGTAGQKIYFTHWADDSVGGDTNNDGTNTTPNPDNCDSVWARIRFGSASDDTSVIEYAVIRYAGDLYHDYYGCHPTAAVEIVDASPTIRNSQLGQNFHDGISFETTLPDTPAAPTIANDSFSSNRAFALSSDVHSQPQVNGNTYTGNIGNGMEIRAGTVQANVAWDQTSTVYIVSGDVTVNSGSQLTIAPGTVVKFQNDKSLLVNGKLVAVGTAGQKIYFTHWADDSVGGDTNNDGTNTTPNPDNCDSVWARIRFGSASDDTSVIEYAVIRYAGDLYHDYYGCHPTAAVEIVDASPTLQYTYIAYNYYYGISFNATYTESQFNTTLLCVDIENNKEYGVYNKTPNVTVQALNLWWGSTTGPYHPTLNPGGQGNAVSNGVQFIPWSTERCVSPGATDHYVYLPLVVRRR